MNLVIILGPAAVGKMAVGQALAELTGLKLLHNHLIRELLLQFIPVDGPGSEDGRRIKNLFTQEILEAVAKSNVPGLIFTNMFNFDAPAAAYKYIQDIVDLYKSYGANTCVVELFADQSVRIERNKTENRLLHKPSKRNISDSENRLRRNDSNQRLNTRDGEQPFENYLKINNTNLTPNEAAIIIKETFITKKIKD